MRERGRGHVAIVLRRRIRDVLAVGRGRDPEWEANVSVVETSRSSPSIA